MSKHKIDREMVRRLIKQTLYEAVYPWGSLTSLGPNDPDKSKVVYGWDDDDFALDNSVEEWENPFADNPSMGAPELSKQIIDDMATRIFRVVMSKLRGSGMDHPTKSAMSKEIADAVKSQYED